MKSIHTLVEDIYNVASPDSSYPMERNILEHMLKNMSHAVCDTSALGAPRQYFIRPSGVGKGLRWHWFMNKYPDAGEVFDGRMMMLFLDGHIQEAKLLAYIKLAGHTVTHEQGKVELAGISGSCDCVIDGYLIDIKTASDYSFKKFEAGQIDLNNDPFGYIAQLSTYKQGLIAAGVEIKGQGWLVYNKNDSKTVLHLIPDTQLVDATQKIEQIREAHKSDIMPEELCPGAEPKAEPNGNLEMSFMCAYCPFKDKCWPDYQVYKYSNKNKLYVKVVKEPRVDNVTKEIRNAKSSV